MERNEGKTIAQHQHELLKETWEVHAILEAIRGLTEEPGASKASCTCLGSLAAMGMEKIEKFWGGFDAFSKELQILQAQSEGGRS